jgi:hypothetical protein
LRVTLRQVKLRDGVPPPFLCRGESAPTLFPPISSDSPQGEGLLSDPLPLFERLVPVGRAGGRPDRYPDVTRAALFPLEESLLAQVRERKGPGQPGGNSRVNPSPTARMSPIQHGESHDRVLHTQLGRG